MDGEKVWHQSTPPHPWWAIFLPIECSYQGCIQDTSTFATSRNGLYWMTRFPKNTTHRSSTALVVAWSTWLWPSKNHRTRTVHRMVTAPWAIIITLFNWSFSIEHDPVTCLEDKTYKTAWQQAHWLSLSELHSTKLTNQSVNIGHMSLWNRGGGYEWSQHWGHGSLCLIEWCVYKAT